MCYYFVKRDDDGRFVVHADETLTAFLELEAALAKTISYLSLLCYGFALI
jgi:hypothetical protein